MEKVRVKYYKTGSGSDRLIKTRYFNTMAEAIASAEEWEARTLDNYAVFA